MNHSLRNQCFDVIRQVLKARGMTYADLAERMAVSEPTIKRLFIERDCKFSRLESICHLLDLSISEVLEIAEREEEPVLTLSRETEQALANAPALFHVYLLLRDDMPPAEIASVYGLEEADLHLYLRDLERLSMVSMGANGQVSPTSTAPLQLSPDGPLQQRHAELNIEFLRHCIQDAVETPEAYVTLSRRMRPATARLLEEDTKAMVTRISRLARQDRLTAKPGELTAFKWSFAHRPASFTSLFSIGPHPAKGRTRTH